MILGIVASITTLAGPFLTIYFYQLSLEFPDVRFAQNPVGTVVLDREKTPELNVNFNGKGIDGAHITRTQVGIWNDGKRAIKADEILNDEKRIEITSRENAPMLDAAVAAVSRPEIGCSLDDVSIDSGRLFVSWKILEQNDWCLIQLTHTGNTDTKFDPRGAIQGQPTIKTTQISRGSILTSQSLVGAIVVALFGTLVCIGYLLRALRSPNRKIGVVVAFIGGLLLCLANVFFWFYETIPETPFRFG